MGSFAIKGIDGRLIGDLREDGVLVCHKKESVHIYRKHNSICICTFTLKKLVSGEIRTEKTNIPCNKVMVILERDTIGGGEEVYETTPQFWIEQGIPIHHTEFEFQTSLPIERWNKIVPELPVITAAVSNSEVTRQKTWDEILVELKIGKM